MNVLTEVASKVLVEYKKTLTSQVKLVDGLIVYAILTAVVQLGYVILVGSFPFNSFLSSFICHIGLFAMAVSLRLQLTSPGEFHEVKSDRAFRDFVLCCLVLFFVVFSFMG